MSSSRSQQDGGQVVVKCPEVKLVLLGDAGVGKSSLAQRFVANHFKPYCETTIGASFLSKILEVDEGRLIKCQIWDTAGQEKYHSLAPMYYRGAGAAILVYDITSRKSFARLKDWVVELRSQGPENILLAMAGNKTDLESKRQVPEKEARAYADSVGAQFLETSAKDDTNVATLFTKLASRIEIPDDKRRTANAAGNNSGFRVVGGGDHPRQRKGCC